MNGSKIPCILCNGPDGKSQLKVVVGGFLTKGNYDISQLKSPPFERTYRRAVESQAYINYPYKKDPVPLL